jgi:hypothetical protein
MRKVIGLLILLVMVLVSLPVMAMDCVPGGSFRGRDGRLLDCLEGAGSDCMSCSETIVVQP